MPAPTRYGVTDAEWSRLVTPLDRAREAVLRRVDDPTDLGGIAVVWRRVDGDRPIPVNLAIQPGIADDLPSLLSALAPEVDWPGVGAMYSGDAVGVWARVWQVREHADLRLVFHWDAVGAFTGEVALLSPAGTPVPVEGTEELVARLDVLAVAPQASATPHATLLAGNRAMDAGDYVRARDAYQQAIDALPRHSLARRNYALALALLGEWDAAAATMAEAWALAPDDEELRQEYLAVETDAGIAAVQRNDDVRAAEHFLHILRHWPDEPTALANLGNLRLREGRVQEARAIFRRFLKFHPHHASTPTIRLALDELGEA